MNELYGGVHKPRWQYFTHMIIDHLPTPCWHLSNNFFTDTRENLYKVYISSTTHLLRLVNVVCQCPLIVMILKKGGCLISSSLVKDTVQIMLSKYPWRTFELWSLVLIWQIWSIFFLVPRWKLYSVCQDYLAENPSWCPA